MDITALCLRVVELVAAKSKGSSQYEESGGQTLMLCLQVVNKISLVLDKYADALLMSNLKSLFEGIRKLPNYGLTSLL